ncbi:unnamed protein product [Kuraishia capsulata CBS 1993]|uniref:Pre-rRNA-processing protein n=1 Tax=Kuraishia capsulata CBS 1993 TaxID=1382522 RepID=W6MU63_9ASCO|nr:uncharacterized protein KUCA_T00001425001 [Kuraishia capsulata CBS 1993]CDK25455.1 unnamed protein product [Kuraishia capsulata CBS 1993]
MAKKKTEKQKDFQKAKLRVGKTAAKPSNYTDTSFKAKIISLPSQSLLRQSQSVDDDIHRYVSLLKHHSSTTRKEALIHLQTHLPSNPSIYKDLVSGITPLILDQSKSVREALQSLLKAICQSQRGIMELHLGSILLFVHSAMTHISPEIRRDSTKFLQVLLENSSDALVRADFVKSLKCFCQLLNWALLDTKKSISLAITTASTGGIRSKLDDSSRASHLKVLANFLHFGLLRETVTGDADEAAATFHPLMSRYMIPSVSQPYSHLKLFERDSSVLTNVKIVSVVDNTDKTSLNLEGITTEDVGTRRKVFSEIFAPIMKKELANCLKEGGAVGKEAKMINDILQQVQAKQEEE